MPAVAEALTEAGIKAPNGDKWTADNLVDHLAAINRDLDKSFQEDGYGA